MQKIRKGDEVVMITGKDKDRSGSVLKIFGNDRVLVQGINIAKKHQKGDPNRGVAGGIIDKEMPVHISNLMLLDPDTGKGGRVGFKLLEDGRKVRYFKSNGEVVDG